MKSKSILLTLLLAAGFSLPTCQDICTCPNIAGEYFNIKGFEAVNYSNSGTQLFNTTINFADYHGLKLDYEVEYHSSNCKKKSGWDFSLVNEALACDCAYNGVLGSKSEMLESLTVLTLNDFDAEHLANDTINDLLEANVLGSIVDLNEYLLQDTSFIQYESLELNLKKAPDLNSEFKVKVILQLSDNEAYEAESEPIKFLK